MGFHSGPTRSTSALVEEERFLNRLIGGLFHELWYAVADADRGAARELYQRLRSAIIRLHVIGEEISEVLGGIDPAWSMFCCVGQVEDLPHSLRQMTELSSAAFETVDEAVDWWVAVRKRELEDELRRTIAMRWELERSRIFQAFAEGSGINEMACSLRARRDALVRRSTTIEYMLGHRHRPPTVYEEVEEEENEDWEEEGYYGFRRSAILP